MKKQILDYSLNTVISVLLSFLITGLLLALSAWIMLSGKLTAGTEKILINAIRIISCLAGGFLSGRRNKKKGFLWGLLVGAFYYGFLILIKSACGGSTGQAPLSMATGLLCCLGSGMLGGMLS